MSHRALLPAEQRDRLFAIPVERAEMAQHYVLGADQPWRSSGPSGAA